MMTEAEKRPMSAGEVHRQLLASWSAVLTGDLDALDLIDEHVIDHRGGREGDHVGRDAWREKWQRMAAAYRERQQSVTVEQQVADGAWSVHRYTTRGTDVETGHPYAVTSMDMIRVVDGRLVEHWAVVDTVAIRAQAEAANQ